MALVISTPRRSPQIRNLRDQTPCVNFQSPLTPCSDSCGSHQVQIFQREAWRKVEEGYGSRHLHDTAPFTLWNSDEHDFRPPTHIETSWILNRYRASTVYVEWPVLYVETNFPPNPVPVTVACVAVRFVPPSSSSSSYRDFYQSIPSVNTSFASPRIPDPISAFNVKAWHLPTSNQQREIINALSNLMNVKAVNFFWPYLIVELDMDAVIYQNHSLPGRVAGFTTIYHRSVNSIWHEMELRTRQRVIDPTSGVQDTTNYLEQGDYTLRPGVRVSSAPGTDEGPYATESYSTTAGVLLRNSDGRVRMTVANHGFPASTQVFHPSIGGSRIGEIDERWLAQDVALVELDPSIKFDNSYYFEAQNPVRLLRSNEVRSKAGKWFGVDGMSTGLIFLFLRGVRLHKADRPGGPVPVQTEFSEWNEESLFQTLGPSGGNLRDGIRGAPIVEDEGIGGVAGCFQLGSVEWCLSPVLDEIIDRGWGVL